MTAEIVCITLLDRVWRNMKYFPSFLKNVMETHRKVVFGLRWVRCPRIALLPARYLSYRYVDCAVSTGVSHVPGREAAAPWVRTVRAGRNKENLIVPGFAQLCGRHPSGDCAPALRKGDCN